MSIECDSRSTTTRVPWLTELLFRVRWHFLIKFVTTSALIALFFLGYFYVQDAPLDTPTVMPLTALDRMIPFHPYALLAYLSLWIYVGVGPGLQRTPAELLKYALWMGSLCITGLGLFYLWPTRLPDLSAEASGPLIEMLRRVDSISNACPSMHVAAAVFTAIRVQDVLTRIRAPRWLQALNILWCLLIAYSTLAIKQHVVLDVLAGALLGGVFGWTSVVHLTLAVSTARARRRQAAALRLD
jgi:membrane-associated phospholipid phosphatase